MNNMTTNLWSGLAAMMALGSAAVATPPDAAITTSLFSDLERTARLVDISYCIGNTGITKPFNCLSRCDEFPDVQLVTTWHTGLLMSDSCGYIAVDHGSPDPSIVVAFRGTYSVANTIVDLSTVPQKYVPYPAPPGGHGDDDEGDGPRCTNCTVHMGFFQSWETARSWVLPELVSLREQYPDHTIHLAGHSLGGAVACLAALELKVSLGWDDVLVTTYGEPRVGNDHMARFIDDIFDLDGEEDLERGSFRRVTHANDPVPLLPLEEWGYEPHSGEIFITKESLSPSESDIVTCVGDTDPDCSAGADGLTRYKLWQIFFAHRDYFWRLGLCAPGGDPVDWPRDPNTLDEL